MFTFKLVLVGTRCCVVYYFYPFVSTKCVRGLAPLIFSGGNVPAQSTGFWIINIFYYSYNIVAYNTFYYHIICYNLSYRGIEIMKTYRLFYRVIWFSALNYYLLLGYNRYSECFIKGLKPFAYSFLSSYFSLLRA